MLQDRHREDAVRIISNRIKTFSHVEKAFYGSVVLSGLLLAIGVVFMQSRLLQVQSEMAQINQEINVKQVEIDDAEQAVNDLVREARLMEIADKLGLTFNNDNIGVVE